MIILKKSVFIILGVILITVISFLIGFGISNNKKEEEYTIFDNSYIMQEEKDKVESIEILNKEEKTTPNTLIIYKTYYTKCKHYIQEYSDIDASLVNLTENEFKEKCNGCNIERFSSDEIEVSKEKETFCGQHYKLKLENNNIIIYNIDENGIETEYECTGITSEYLTKEDILKLTSGIYVYGKENLTSTIEDYE